MKPILKITFFSVFFLYIGVYFGRADLKQKIDVLEKWAETYYYSIVEKERRGAELDG